MCFKLRGNLLPLKGLSCQGMADFIQPKNVCRTRLRQALAINGSSRYSDLD